MGDGRAMAVTAWSLGVALAALVAGCGTSSPTGAADGAAPVPDNVVAVFAGEQLTVDEFEKQYAKSVGGHSAAVDDSLSEYQDFLRRYVDFRLKVIDAEAHGIDRDSALVAELQQYHDQLAKPYIVDKEVTEGIVKDLFEKQKQEVTASHILVRVEDAGSPADTLASYERISAYRDSVLAGVDFNDLAAEYSDDPSAKRNRGFLGTFSGGRMIIEFETRAYSTPVGQPSDIFRTRFGYHLLFVHDRGPRTPDRSASHILIRAADDDTLAAWEKVQEVQARLDAGDSFADVAREFSEDPGSAAQGGSLGFFGKGRMVPAFEEAAFALERVGDRSDWFRTRFGYHIIQLDEFGTSPSYDEAYPELKVLAQRLPRFKVAEAELAREYKASLGTTVDSAAVDSLLSDFAPDSVLYYVALHEWSPEEKAVTIARIGDYRLSLGDFLAFGNERRRAAPRSYGRDRLFVLIDEMLDARAVDAAASKLEERDPEFAALMEEYQDGVVLFKVMEDSVWTRASTDSAGLRTVYEANRSSYTFPERMRVISFAASSDSLLGVLADSWRPDSAASFDLLFEEDSRFRVDTMFVSDSTRSIYDQVLGLDVGQTVGPRPYRGGFILLAVDGIEAPREKTFEEARADVVSEYQTAVEEAWLKRLHDRYDAEIYAENLVSAFEDEDGSRETSPASDDTN